MLLNSKSGLLAKATVIIALLFGLTGCRGEDDPLIVYSGKGLKLAMDEVAALFEEETGTPVQLIYAGSNTLLSTIKKTQSGDIFVPGSQSYIANEGELIAADGFVAYHVPTIAVSQHSSSEIRSFEDLAKPDIKIAVGNADMAAIGRITNAILKEIPSQVNFRDNIVVTVSTVNELIQLVVDGEVDAALIWRDMLNWDGADRLSEVAIPNEYNKIKEIRVGVLSTANAPKVAKEFYGFLISDGRQVFVRHGFTEK